MIKNDKSYDMMLLTHRDPRLCLCPSMCVCVCLHLCMQIKKYASDKWVAGYACYTCILKYLLGHIW